MNKGDWQHSCFGKKKKKKKSQPSCFFKAAHLRGGPAAGGGRQAAGSRGRTDRQTQGRTERAGPPGLRCPPRPSGRRWAAAAAGRRRQQQQRERSGGASAAERTRAAPRAMRSTPLAGGEPWPRLCAAELGGLRRLRRKQGCKSFRVELKVLSGRRTGLRAPPPPPPPPPPAAAAWEPRSAALGPPAPAAASAFPAAPPPPPPPAARPPPPPPPPAASPRPRPGEASGVSPEIKALQQTRRLLANARERTRVHTISAAFEALRKQVPCYSYGQKLSKLAILRIACNYILSLARLADLDYSADHSNMSFSECVEQCTRTLQAEGRSKKRKE
ncbi:transcription factor ATOH8 isoform X2 [Larus michahellis]|uniref:transcription factor ATOH8 isoform X2 n=1 Tax=Larus michahellis TaxID=119627 RepID=UPI003D9B50CD